MCTITCVRIESSTCVAGRTRVYVLALVYACDMTLCRRLCRVVTLFCYRLPVAGLGPVRCMFSAYANTRRNKHVANHLLDRSEQPTCSHFWLRRGVVGSSNVVCVSPSIRRMSVCACLLNVRMYYRLHVTVPNLRPAFRGRRKAKCVRCDCPQNTIYCRAYYYTR